MTTVVLPEALTIAAVRPLRTAILEAFDGPPPYSLDARQVDDIDGAGVQLLLSAARELESRGTHLEIHLSPALRDTLTGLAVLDRFALADGDAA